MSKPISCNLCKFYKPTSAEDLGRCFFNPPVVTDKSASLRPLTAANDYCNSFTERD